MPGPRGVRREGGADGEGLPTLHEQIEAVGWGKFQRVALLAFVLFVISEAMEVTVPNVVWERGDGGGAFGRGLEESSTFRAIVVSAPMLGNLAGSVCGGAVADTYGRHAAIYLHSALFVTASIASGLCSSEDKISFVASRVALGLSLGIVVPVIVSYMAELSPSAKRARAVVVIPGFGFPCGQIVMFCCGLLLHRLDSGSDLVNPTAVEARFDWRKMMLVAGIIPNLVAAFIVYRFVPESPHFLVGVGKKREAEIVVRHIAQVNGSQHRLLSDGLIQPIRRPRALAVHRTLRPAEGCASGNDFGEDDAGEETGNDFGEDGAGEGTRMARWQKQGMELLSPPLHTYMLLVLAMWMSAGFGQFGADVILPKVLETALDLNVQGRLTALLGIAICAWPSFLLVIFLLERDDQWSRRGVCVWMSAASCGTSIIAGVCVHRGLAPLLVSSTLLKMMSHGAMTTMDLYAAELLPSTHRATGLALANGASKLVGVLASFVAMAGLSSGGFAASFHYLLFALAFALAALVSSISPDVREDLHLVMDFEELCRVHDERSERGAGGGGTGRAKPLYGTVGHC